MDHRNEHTIGRAAGAALAGLFGLSLLAVTAAVPVRADSYPEEELEYALASRLAAATMLLDVARAGDRLIAVGEFGHIVYSDDNGESWTQAAAVPTQVTLTSVVFPSAKVGYAAGHDSAVLKTEDGGDNWTLVYKAPEAETPIMTMIFDSESHGLVMGAFSFVMETFDGGNSWEQRQLVADSEDDFHLNKAFAAKNGAIFVAAEFGTVYRSTDNGKTFEAIQTPYNGSFWGGLGLSDGSVLIYGMRGNVYRSTDNGTTWRQVASGSTKSFGGGTQLADGTVVLAGLNGEVIYSSDMGRNFTAVTRADRLGFNAVAEGREGQIIIFGEPGAKIMPASAAQATGS